MKEFTFNNKQSLQTLWVVVFKHLEDLVTKRNQLINLLFVLVWQQYTV